MARSLTRQRNALGGFGIGCVIFGVLGFFGVCVAAEVILRYYIFAALIKYVSGH